MDVFFKLMGMRAGKSLQSRADHPSVDHQKSGINLADSASKLGQAEANAAAARRQKMKTPAKKSKIIAKSPTKSALKAKPVVKTPTKAKTSVKPLAKPPVKPAGKAKPTSKSASKTAAKPAVKPSAKKPTKMPTKAHSKAIAKPVSKAKPKTPVKPVAKTPAKKVTVKKSTIMQQTKTLAKPAVKTTAKVVLKTPSKPVVKPSPKSSSPSPAQKKVPLKSTQKASVQPAGKPLAKPSAKPPAKPVIKTAVKPVAKPAVKTATRPDVKPSAKAPAKPVTPAKAVVPVVVGKPVVPPPAPPKPTKAGARVVPSYSPSAANMSPHGGNTAAKASFTISAPVLAPPPQTVIKKDAKLANNWKTKAADLLSDAEVIAMPDSEYMNAKQLAFFRGKLVTLKNGILSNAGETTEHLREDTSVVPDPADRATIEEEHALELRTRDRERKLLKKIEQSIVSIDAEEYGYCDETGEPIGVPRLIARPTATLSLEAQQRRELKQKMFGD